MWNFNTANIQTDNLLKQFKLNKKEIIFYGDDTWLKMFSEKKFFLRSEGVTSFIASDYYEVDSNVTRHHNFELKATDWDVFIMHYLGLDHIGHIEGPFNQNMRIKLTEMDEIILNIYDKISQTDRERNISSLIAILSDHGMADQGGHGGSTQSEIKTPLLLINDKFFSQNPQLEGKFELNQIDFTSTISCLFGLPIPESNEGVSFINKLMSNNDRLVFSCLYNNFLQLNKKYKLTKDHDFSKKILDIKKMYKENADISVLKEKLETLLRSANINNESNDHLNSPLMLFLILVMFIITFIIMSYVNRIFEEMLSNDLAKFQLISFIIYILSLFSSSFIEEEHQFWYMSEQIQYILLLLQNLKISIKNRYEILLIISKITLVLLCSRISRMVNQTGNKWINEKDIGDLLRELSSKVPLAIVTIISMLFLYIFTVKRQKLKTLNHFFIIIYHLTSIFQVLSQFERNRIAQLSYVLTFGAMIYDIWQKNYTKEIVFEFFLNIIILIQPSHNLILIFLWQTKWYLLKDLLKSIKTLTNLNLAFLIVTMIRSGYFSIGNSNSLSTVLVSSGFIGVNQMNEIIIGALIFISTYSSHIFWLTNYSLSSFKFNDLLGTLISMDFIVTSFYTLSAWLQREHIFIWSVFAPRLIYQFFHLLFDFIFIPLHVTLH